MKLVGWVSINLHGSHRVLQNLIFICTPVGVAYESDNRQGEVA